VGADRLFRPAIVSDANTMEPTPAYFEIARNGWQVRFSLADAYSRQWFLPRYSGGKLHEPPVTEALLACLKQAHCFVDVGANLGWYACLASKVMPAGKVFAFEMDALNFAILEENLALNHCHNVHASQRAVAETPGTVGYERRYAVPNPMLKMTTGTSARCIQVQAISLDFFFQDRGVVPDVVKIDVEGAEMKVLQGMADLVRTSRPTLFVEIHPQNLQALGSSCGAVLAYLSEQGYEIQEILDIRKHAREHHLREVTASDTFAANTMLCATPGRHD
jgi:FkbM family methyltransferase